MTTDGTANTSYADAFFAANTADIDPRVDLLIKLEEERQRRRIILIPSESYAPLPVRQALGSVFTNVYAEGYPPSQMVRHDEALLSDLAQQLAYYRRYADRRFYKGADYVHFVETLAQRRAAECFANERVSADQIFVNVQPLSGAAANLSVYDALMEPGDTLMGMDLFQGGHLTHGSEFNVSGKRYNVVSYGISKADSRLDYEEILEIAERSRPKVIVAGYTSYPWAPDFHAFRRIADHVGAFLVADIAHPAGMVIAGQYPNPVGIAHVSTFTTHKTLCGPRGACVMTTDADLSRRIDRAVFPGMQGGPHVNKFAAMCVAFEIARTEAFRDLQRRIVENAQALAKGLTERGLELAYGGTDTHLLLLDLKSVHPDRGGRSNAAPLYGEVVARILELAGIVVNKNTIPGDTITALATGIRMGTPWISQRGMGPVQVDKVAECIVRIVTNIIPFYYDGRRGRLPRGKIDIDVLEEVKWAIDELACQAQAELEHTESTYPHYCLRPREIVLSAPLFAADAPDNPDASSGGTELVDLSDVGIVQVSGWRAQAFLDDTCTADVAGLEPGQGMRSFLLDRQGLVLDDVTLWRLERDARARDRYLVFTDPENLGHTVSWMRGLSDGYVLFDDQDVWRKVRGPVKVEVLSDADAEGQMTAIALRGAGAACTLTAALAADLDRARPFAGGRFGVVQASRDGHELWVAQGGYATADDQIDIVGPVQVVRDVWDALRRASVPAFRAPEARRTLRRAAGLPERWPANNESGSTPGGSRTRDAATYRARFPRLFSLRKPYFVGQGKLPAPDGPVDKQRFTWREPVDAPLKQTPLCGEHERLGAKLISFAGWEMPVWYSSVSEEHQAVREAAGLFDVAHMGTMEVSGPYAADFLDLVSVNYVRWLDDGDSQYSGLLDADGLILDDIIVYRRAWDRFFVVVNAANFDKDWAWLNAVNENRVVIDNDRPWVDVPHPAVLRSLKDPSSGPDQRIDIALQGPRSLDILLACVDDPALRSRLVRLQRAKFIEGSLAGIDLLISRTGYTGESVGYELYVHPDRAVALWRMLLERGESFGVKPCGLAARDSTRIEAGLPLYGHELAGPLGISQSEAGFGSYVKYHKPFFVGRTLYKAYNDESERVVVRFQIVERGARALRGGEHGEPVVNKRGKVVGTVTSCALVGDRQVGMALIEGRYTEIGTELQVFPSTRRAVTKPPEAFAVGDTIAMPVRAEVIERFPRM